MQQTTLFSVNSRTNSSTRSTRNLDTNSNIEFSYDDILRDEVSKISKQRKRSNANKQLAQSNADARPILNSTPQISLLPNYISNLSFGSAQNQVIKGDVNRDGIVDRNDVDALERHIVGLNDDVDIESSDMNGDGKINITDVAKLELYVQETKKSQEKTQILKGDANGDGKVNYKDLELTKRKLSEQNVNIDMKAADMDDNGEITLSDFSDINHLTKKYEDKFQTIRGDSNGDGVVNEKDYANIKDFINNVNSSDDFIMKNSDINDDGRVNDKDLQAMRNILTNRPVDWNESKRLLGDADGDGEVSVADAQRVLNYTRGKIQLNQLYRDNADVNGDGMVDDRDVQGIKNILTERPIDWNESKRLLGDANGDGEVSIADAQRVLNYARGKINLNELYSDNADVNKDGVIDEKDAEGITNILRYGTVTNPNEQQNIPVITVIDNQSEEQQNIPIITVIDSPTDSNYELVTAARRAETYADSSLTYKKKSNEYIKEGGQFIILQETDNAYEVRYNTDEGLKDRWVSKDILIPKSVQPEQVVTPAYQEQPQYFTPYSTNVSFDLDTYSDSSMGKKIGRVFKDEPITVLNETEDALQIRYGVGTYPNYTSFKTGWIPKNIIIQDDPTEQLDTNNSDKMVTIPINNDDKNTLDNFKPNMTEEVTDSARIFYVNPGYNQGDYYKEEGGLIITNLKVDKNPNVEKPITFDVYNTKDAMGIIEYYDENGKFIRADRIDPHSIVIKDFDSWWEKAKNTVDSIAKYGFFDDVPITHPSVSKHITVEAPKGTHEIVVTNNQNESVYAKVYNFVDEIFKAKKFYKNVKALLKDYDAFKKDDAASSLIEDVKENFVQRIIHYFQENIARMARDNNYSEDKINSETLKSLFKKFGEKGIKDLVLRDFNLQEVFEDTLEYAIKNSGKMAFDEAKKFASKICKDLLKGNPAIFGLDALSLTGNLLDNLSKSLTEKRLENVKPMIFQLET